MSLESIVARVLDDARAEADRVLADQRAKAAEIVRAGAERARAEAEAVRREAEAAAAREAARIVTQARLERRIELLAARKAVIDEALALALAKPRVRGAALSKTVVSREGSAEEPFDRDKLVEEVRPGLESALADVLGI